MDDDGLHMLIQQSYGGLYLFFSSQTLDSVYSTNWYNGTRGAHGTCAWSETVVSSQDD